MNVKPFYPVAAARQQQKSKTGYTALGLQESDVTIYGAIGSPFYLAQPLKPKRRKSTIPSKSTVDRDGHHVSSSATSNQLESNFKEEKAKNEIVAAKSQIKPCETSPSKNCPDASEFKVKRLRKHRTIFD